MTEAFWIVLVTYIVFLAFSLFSKREYMIKTVAGLIGVLFSVSIMAETNTMPRIVGFVILVFNVYILASALLIEGGK